jgi:hypothetical protein
MSIAIILVLKLVAPVILSRDVALCCMRVLPVPIVAGAARIECVVCVVLSSHFVDIKGVRLYT